VTPVLGPLSANLAPIRNNLNAAAKQIATKLERRIRYRSSHEGVGAVVTTWALEDANREVTHTLVLSIALPLWADRRTMGWDVTAVLTDEAQQGTCRSWGLVNPEQRLTRPAAVRAGNAKFCQWAAKFGNKVPA
jgi:hypothetical protein